MHCILEELRTQRWDDHRYYHHSRINQALHLVSACSFLVAYALLLVDPPMAALIAWLVGMTTRQIGHFFFEPKGYDHVNDATHAYKEEVKVGYNLQRKVVLMGIWGLLPAALLLDPTLFGLLPAHGTWQGYARNLGMIWLWLGVGGVIFRMLQLFFLKDVQAGCVWAAKILTDPFHDIALYWRSPLYLLRGELIDPTIAVHNGPAEDSDRTYGALGLAVAERAIGVDGPIREYYLDGLHAVPHRTEICWPVFLTGGTAA